MEFNLELTNRGASYKSETIMKIEFSSTDAESIEAVANAVGRTLQAWLNFKATQAMLGVTTKEDESSV